VEKLVYLLWGDAAAGEELGDRLRSETAPRLLAAGVHGLGVNVHDAAAAETPAPVPTPDDEQPHIAEVSVWVDCADRRAPIEAAVADVGTPWAGYLVAEALYDDYGTTRHAPARHWPDGDRSPGVLTVALIHRPDGLDRTEWIRRWHGTQSPLSAELQPRTRYVRNEVVRPVTDGAPPVDGIVEEAWPSARHVADPMLFYNASTKDELDANIRRMLNSVNACLDLARLRSSTMSEYLLRSW